MKGVSYLYDGLKWPGSKLGSAYSAGLPERGVAYATETSVEPKDQPEVLKPVSKMPAMLKPLILPEHYPAKELTHAAHQTEVTLDTSNFNNQVINNINVGPASTAMLLIAGVLANASLSLINMVIAFLKRLLAFFGFGMRQSSHQAHQHPDASAPPLCYEPTKLAALPAPKSAEDKVAMELYQVARALEENDPSLLPVLDDEEVSKARAEVVFAMENDEKDDGLAGASAAAAESDIFGIKEEDFSSAPSIDPIDGLKTALKACVMANFYHEKAGRKNVPLHIDVSDEKQKLVNEIILARKKAENDFETWKVDQGYFKSRLPSSTKNNFESEIARLEKLEIESKNDHQNEVIKTTKYEKQLKDSPAPIVPATVTAAAESARSALLRARQSVQNQAILMIDALRRDPKQVAKMGVFEF